MALANAFSASIRCSRRSQQRLVRVVRGLVSQPARDFICDRTNVPHGIPARPNPVLPVVQARAQFLHGHAPKLLALELAHK